MFAHVAQMEQQVGRGAEHWRAEHGQRRAGIAVWHHAGMAVSPAGVRMAGGPKILVLDGYEGNNHQEGGVWRDSSSRGVSLGKRHHLRSCRWKPELCMSPGQQPASL